MLEYLFANKNVEKVLMYLCLHSKANASELSRAFGTALDPIQKTLKKLEAGGLLASFLEGRTDVIPLTIEMAWLCNQNVVNSQVILAMNYSLGGDGLVVHKDINGVKDLGIKNYERLMVNSFHNFGFTQEKLGKGLKALAGKLFLLMVTILPKSSKLSKQLLILEVKV